MEPGLSNGLLSISSPMNPFSITNIIIGITVAASLYAWSNESILRRWIMNPYQINRRKEYFRFITSGLIHADYVHLGFNMLTFYSFGNLVEYYFLSYHGSKGILLYLLLYFAGMVVADLPDYVKHKSNPSYNALGASGAVSAVLLSGIMFNPLSPVSLFFAIRIPGFIFAALYLFYSYYQGKRGMDNIGHNAHFYGAVFGLLLTILSFPEILPNFIEGLSRFRFF
jgi:membrane associated rhomboid family serine protease